MLACLGQTWSLQLPVLLESIRAFRDRLLALLGFEIDSFAQKDCFLEFKLVLKEFCKALGAGRAGCW